MSPEQNKQPKRPKPIVRRTGRLKYRRNPSPGILKHLRSGGKKGRKASVARWCVVRVGKSIRVAKVIGEPWLLATKAQAEKAARSLAGMMILHTGPKRRTHRR